MRILVPILFLLALAILFLLSLDIGLLTLRPVPSAESESRKQFEQGFLSIFCMGMLGLITTAFVSTFLARTWNRKKESLSYLGMLLGAVGGGLMGLFLLCGVPTILLARLDVRPRADSFSPLALSLLGALAGAFVFLAGVLCVRAADRAEGRPLKLLGAILAVLAGATLSVMFALVMGA
jgi:hypothetical protein